MSCNFVLGGICWVSPTAAPVTVFGFAEVMTALTLLMVFYTISDARYRFRMAIAPLPITKLGFWSLGAIGLLSLITDMWFAEGWAVPVFVDNQVFWQSAFAIIFLAVVFLWIYHGFINPPIFSHRNAKQYFQVLFTWMVRGADDELTMIAHELHRSAEALVRLSWRREKREEDADPVALYKKHSADTANYAFNILLLIGSRKLCRHMARSSPLTAITLFEAMSDHKKYVTALGPFAMNIASEAILYEESPLYHEESGYYEGLMGYWRPFSMALYGDYSLVEAMGQDNRSPLDIDYQQKSSWNHKQFEAYARVALIAWESYLQASGGRSHSYTMYRAFGAITQRTFSIYKLDGVDEGAYESEQAKDLQTAVQFLCDAVDKLGKLDRLPPIQRSRGRQQLNNDIFDLIAKAMFDVLFNASKVRGPVTVSWELQHSNTWARFFSFNDSASWRIVRRKLCRLLYEEIKVITNSPNFKTARILGICLNVMGLQLRRRQKYGQPYYPLHKAVLNLARNHFLAMQQSRPAVANAVITGSLTLDLENKRLVKTYTGWYGEDGEKEYLDLAEPQAQQAYAS